MPQWIHQAASTPGLTGQANGFILLEVLVAMSLVATSWMALGSTYQQMVLRLGQLQAQKEQMKKELDQHELAVLTVAQSKNTNHKSRKSINEPVGMSRRSLPVPSFGRTAHKK